jgi:hypothetical protein
MKTRPGFSNVAPALLVLLFSLTISAHEDDSHKPAADMDMDMAMSGVDLPLNSTSYNETMEVPINYFRHEEYSYLILTHIALMVIGWVFVLPLSMRLR